MSETKTPAKPAEMKVSDNNTKQKNAGGKAALVAVLVVAIIATVVAALVGGTYYAVATAVVFILLLAFIIDHGYNSTTAGPSNATVPTVTVRRKKAAPKKKAAPLSGEAEASVVAEAEPEVKPIDAAELKGLLAKMDEAGYDVALTMPGHALPDDDHEPTNVTDKVGTAVEIWLKVLLVIVVAAASLYIVVSNESLVKAIWGRKAPAGEVMPEFNDNTYKQIVRKDGKTVVFPKFTDGTIWAINVPGKDSVYIDRTGENEVVKITEGMDTMTVVAKDVYPSGTSIHMVPNDGRKPSIPRNLPDLK